MPLTTRVHSNREPLETRLRRHMEIQGDCWVWTAYKNKDGYGIMVVKWSEKWQTFAHRISYETFVGKIPEGLALDHLCRNRACINPAHLEPVTFAENQRRVSYKYCRRGHEFTPENSAPNGSSGRKCRECARRYQKARYHRMKCEAA